MQNTMNTMNTMNVESISSAIATRLLHNSGMPKALKQTAAAAMQTATDLPKPISKPISKPSSKMSFLSLAQTKTQQTKHQQRTHQQIEHQQTKHQQTKQERVHSEQKSAEIKKYFPNLDLEKSGTITGQGRQWPYNAEKNNSEARSLPLRDLRNLQNLPKTAAQPRANNGIPDDAEHQRLYEATIQLQSIFIQQMLGSMQKNAVALSNGEDTLLRKSFQEEVFTDMLHQEYAQEMSRSPQFDLAMQMYRQLAPAIPAPAPASAAPTRTPTRPAPTLQSRTPL